MTGTVYSRDFLAHLDRVGLDAEKFDKYWLALDLVSSNLGMPSITNTSRISSMRKAAVTIGTNAYAINSMMRKRGPLLWQMAQAGIIFQNVIAHLNSLQDGSSPAPLVRGVRADLRRVEFGSLDRSFIVPLLLLKPAVRPRAYNAEILDVIAINFLYEKTKGFSALQGVSGPAKDRARQAALELVSRELGDEALAKIVRSKLLRNAVATIGRDHG